MVFTAVRWFRSSIRLCSKQNFYKTLGISKKSSQAEIKQAYFNLAKKYHPDVSKEINAKDKFSQINTAYETLGDDLKKKAYDQTGMTGDEQDQARQNGFDPKHNKQDFTQSFYYEDVFEEFENMYKRQTKTPKREKGEDIVITIEIPFLDAARGTTKEIKVERKATCPTCKGSKCQPGTSPTKCSACGGAGTVYYQNGRMIYESTCNPCQGTGKKIKHWCPTCTGCGFKTLKENDTVSIPSGVGTGHILRMAKKGHLSETGGAPGDLLIKMAVGDHPVFKRDGYDITSEIPITISQAALGSEIKVDTLYGQVNLKIEKGTNTGDRSRLSNYGIQHLPPAINQRGSHYVKFKVVIPRSCTPKQIELFERLAELKL